MGPRLFSRGNGGKGAIEKLAEALLQWGHDFSAVEISFWRTGIGCWKRSSFNGATTFQPWKSCQNLQLSEPSMPLQWGHDFSAVEIEKNLFSSHESQLKLQWGHDFSAVEMVTFTFLRNLVPSKMLQWGHDFSAVEIL